VGWKKFERLWGSIISLKQLTQMRPLLETILSPVRATEDLSASSCGATVTPDSVRDVQPVAGPVKADLGFRSRPAADGRTPLTR
jgi:hypothetical protein